MRPDLDIFAIGLKGYVAGETSGGGGGGGGGALVPVEVVQPATQTLRVLEITRRSDGKPARLILGERTTISDAARQSEDIRRKVNQLLRV
jgi:ribulose 1,5-bisphosphate synthetase/thiazole synthase